MNKVQALLAALRQEGAGLRRQVSAADAWANGIRAALLDARAAQVGQRLRAAAGLCEARKMLW